MSQEPDSAKCEGAPGIEYAGTVTESKKRRDWSKGLAFVWRTRLIH